MDNMQSMKVYVLNALEAMTLDSQEHNTDTVMVYIFSTPKNLGESLEAAYDAIDELARDGLLYLRTETPCIEINHGHKIVRTPGLPRNFIRLAQPIDLARRALKGRRGHQS